MAWKVVVDFDLCESNAICMGIVPEVFEVRDDNFLYVLQENPPDELREKCDQAVRQCPKQAISIDESRDEVAGPARLATVLTHGVTGYDGAPPRPAPTADDGGGRGGGRRARRRRGRRRDHALRQ